MKKKTHIPAPAAAAPAKKIDFMQEAKAMLESIKYMALHPAEASKMEMQRPEIGFKTAALWLVPSYVILILFVGMVILAAPTMTAPGPGGEIVEVPKMAAFLFYSAATCIGWTLMAILTMGILHILALPLGGKGEMKNLAHLLARLLLVRTPLELGFGILSLYLPSLMLGTMRYSLGGLLVDVYFVFALSQMLPIIYGVSKNKGILISILWWLIITLIGIAAGGAMASAGAVA